MATAKDIVDLAASFVGVNENPPDSNNVIFNTDYYGRHVYGGAYPWCCAFGSFSFSISPSKEHPGLISVRWTGWISLKSKGLSRIFSNITVQKHQFFSAQLCSQSNSHIHT